MPLPDGWTAKSKRCCGWNVKRERVVCLYLWWLRSVYVCVCACALCIEWDCLLEMVVLLIAFTGRWRGANDPYHTRTAYNTPEDNLNGTEKKNNVKVNNRKGEIFNKMLLSCHFELYQSRKKIPTLFWSSRFGLSR